MLAYDDMTESLHNGNSNKLTIAFLLIELWKKSFLPADKNHKHMCFRSSGFRSFFFFASTPRMKWKVKSSVKFHDFCYFLGNCDRQKNNATIVFVVKFYTSNSYRIQQNWNKLWQNYVWFLILSKRVEATSLIYYLKII